MLTARARMTGISGRLIEATMGAMAHLSAQIPTGVAATSTFEPVWYAPVESKTHAPTRKLEYGPVDVSATAHHPGICAAKKRAWMDNGAAQSSDMAAASPGRAINHLDGPPLTMQVDMLPLLVFHR